MNEKSHLTEPVGFHMVESEGDNHSLTKEELAEYLAKQKNSALNEARTKRKKYIIALLRANNINPQEVDIEDVLNGNIPDWLRELANNTPAAEIKVEETKSKYIKLTSGLTIRIDTSERTAYRFNPETQEWNKDSTLFAEYEHGELHFENIDFDDFYPIGEEYHYGRRL